jgi:HK97 family phage major capsid protein
MLKRSTVVPASVVALLVLGAPANAIFLNDVDVTIQAHRDRQSELVEAQTTIVATADAESRELTVEEKTQLDELSAEFERLDGEIDRRTRAQAQFDSLNASRGRQAAPDPTIDEPAAPPLAAGPGGRPSNAAPPGRVPAAPRVSANGNFGFRNFGEFAFAVRNANPKFGQTPDQRLIKNASATTYGSEGSGADGGFAVPPDFRSDIMTKVFGEDSLVGRTDRQVTSSNQITIPMDMSTPWDTTGGIQAYWTSEAAAITQSKPVLEEVTVKAHKLAVLVPVTEELAEDAPALDGYLRRKVPEKMDFKISNALVRGNGVGQPLGFLNSPCLATVAAETQSADTIVAANVLKMFAAMPVQSRATAVWLIHPDAEPQLPLLTIGDQAVYMPAGGLRGSPFGLLLGRPVIPHQVCETVGDLGDILFVDFNQYLTLSKTGGGRDTNGARTDVSMHLWFDQDLVAYKTTIRLGGQPWWSEATSSRDGSFAQSPFVALAARAG